MRKMLLSVFGDVQNLLKHTIAYLDAEERNVEHRTKWSLVFALIYLN